MTNELKLRLAHALTSQTLANEVETRLISSTPSTPAAAQTILNSFDTGLNDDLAESWDIALGDDDVSLTSDNLAKNEISFKLNAMIDVLQAKADEIAAVAATFTGQVAGMTTDVTIDADNTGAAGNSVSLSFDGIDDIDTAISDWNTANPTNTVTLTSGDGSQVPDNLETIGLSGGSDASAPALAGAKTAMGSSHMSDAIFEKLVHAVTDRAYATEFKTAFNAMIDYVQAITVS